MSEDQFMKLLKYMEERFDESDKKINRVQSNVDGIRSAVGELSADIHGMTQQKISQ